MSELAGAASAAAHPWIDGLDGFRRIPAPEQGDLLARVTEAVDLAEAGHREAGHDLLVMGIQAAEDHWNGNPWGQDLVECYQEALARYDRTYTAVTGV